MIGRFTYHNESYEYQLSYSKRKTLGIYVHPDKSIEVRAPKDAELEKVSKKVEKRKRWIIKQIRFFDRFHPRSEQLVYKTGATHRYLGRQYRLKIEKCDFEQVKLVGGRIVIQTPVVDEYHVEKLLGKWYHQRSQEYLSRRFQLQFDELADRLPVNRSDVSLAIKEMKRSWGRCKGRSITLNSELIKAPLLGVDYVIVHELAHLKHPYHDQHFHSFMDRVRPRWRRDKEMLERSYY